MLYGLITVLCLAAVIYLSGKKTEEADQMKQVLDDIHTANVARDRLRSSPDVAARVRALFTRKLL